MFSLVLGDLEQNNWPPRISTVENTLAAWKGRSLSYRGRALVINAQSLVHTPSLVLSELCNFGTKFHPLQDEVTFVDEQIQVIVLRYKLYIFSCHINVNLAQLYHLAG